ALWKSGRLHGELARRQREEDETSHLLHIALVDEVQRIKVRNFARDLTGEPFRVEMSDVADAVRSGLDRSPRLFRADPDRAGESDACYDYSAQLMNPHAYETPRDLLSILAAKVRVVLNV